MIPELAPPQFILAVAAGISLAAAVGFRVFAPMLLVSLAARTGHLTLAGGFDWLGSDVAVVMLGVAAVAEVLAYFVPLFDHLLDAVSGPMAVAAGTGNGATDENREEAPCTYPDCQTGTGRS